MDVPARWAEVVQRREQDVPLDEAALLISARPNPGLDVGAQLGRLDAIAARVGQPEIAAVRRVLFEELGLRGDRDSYDDPANSYLDRVLDRGLGIPISLSVVLVEVGRRLGVRLEAVGMPGHFLVRDPSAPDELIDAFDRGRLLDRAACERLFRSVTGGASRLTSDMLVAIGPHAILARMLANLDRSFERRGDRRALGWVSELRMGLPGAPLGDRVQLAARLAVLGRFDAGAAVLEEAAAEVPDDARDRMMREAKALRAKLN